jgi:hypothetical protein
MYVCVVVRCLFKTAALISVLALLLLSPQARCRAATVLPVGPISFNSNSEYDSAFKESNPMLASLQRDAAGNVSLFNTQTSLAIFDTSASGGVGGNGGLIGSDANNDLSDFTISADFASTLPGIGGGFLLRLNSSEANGYAVRVHNIDPLLVVFDVFKGASAMSAGFQIFSTGVPLPIGSAVAANTFYTFKVTVVGGTFTLDFANGAAKATFTDFAPGATVGQVGIVVDNLAPGATARLDNFRIAAVPEPSSLVLAALAGIIPLSHLVRGRRRRS